MQKLAILGHTGTVPPRMTASLDVDAFTRRDPGRIFDLTAEGHVTLMDLFEGMRADPKEWRQIRKEIKKATSPAKF